MGGGCTFRGKGLVTWGVGGGGGAHPALNTELKALAESEEKVMEGTELQMQVTEGGRRSAGRSLSVSGPASSPGQGSPHQSKLFKKLYRLAKSDSSS